MLKILYIVKDIVGDYGILIDENNNENNVAMFLLPENLNIGDKILFENFTYTLIS